MWRKGIRKFSLMTIHVFWAGYLQKIHCDICSDGMLAFGQKWTWSCDQCWHLQTDKTRISHNGAMKARAKSVYFEPGCEKLACETFKSLDSCAARPKENESYVSCLWQSNRQRQIRKGGRSWVLAKKEIAMFSIEPVCSKSLLQQIH